MLPKRIGNNIEEYPFRQRAAYKANLLIAQGIALGIVYAREDALKVQKLLPL